MTKQNLPTSNAASGQVITIKKEKKTAPSPPLVDLPQDDLTPTDLSQSNGEEVFEEDFTDTENEFPMAEEGTHHAKVIDFEKSESQAGNPQYVWQFRITAGNSKDIELKHWTSLLPQARWKAAETLVAVGVPAAGSIAKFSKNDLLGKPCIIEVFHDVFEGRTNHKIKKVYPPNKDSIKFAKTDEVPF